MPVQPGFLSPDGSRYAYLATGGIGVVTVATGDRIKVGQDFPVGQLVGVGAQGVYVVRNDGKPGLWLVPFSGAAQQVGPFGDWTAANGSYAYGSETAYPEGPPTTANTIDRIDLKTGAVSAWFTRPGAVSWVRGIDAQGDPFIQVAYFPGQRYQETWVARGPDDAYPIFGSAQGLTYANGPTYDTNGVWIVANSSGASNLLLFVPGSGLYWMSSYGVVPAGSPCI